MLIGFLGSHGKKTPREVGSKAGMRQTTKETTQTVTLLGRRATKLAGLMLARLMVRYSTSYQPATCKPQGLESLSPLFFVLVLLRDCTEWKRGAPDVKNDLQEACPHFYFGKCVLLYEYSMPDSQSKENPPVFPRMALTPF